MEFNTTQAEAIMDQNGENKIDTYTLCMVEDIQDTYEYGKLYLVGTNDNYWLSVFHCPCGCGELLELLLIDAVSPHWSTELIDDEHVNLSPSIWKIHGCRSHFFVKNNHVIWVSEHKDDMHIIEKE